MKPTFLLFAAAALFAADFAAEGDLWWAHIQFLADDKLQGRDVGTDGYREAVRYVAGKMETYGLKPAGTDGYLQNVKFETRQVVDDQSSLAIVREDAEVTPARARRRQSARSRSRRSRRAWARRCWRSRWRTRLSARLPLRRPGASRVHRPEARHRDHTPRRRKVLRWFRPHLRGNLQTGAGES